MPDSEDQGSDPQTTSPTSVSNTAAPPSPASSHASDAQRAERSSEKVENKAEVKSTEDDSVGEETLAAVRSTTAGRDEQDHAPSQEEKEGPQSEGGPHLQPQPSEGQAPYSVFSKHQTAMTIAIIAVAGFFSPINSNIYFPVIPQLASDLGRTIQDINLTVTVYLIFQGLSPSLFASLSDIYGRRVIYMFTLLVYLLSNIGLALQREYLALMLLRISQSCGASSAIALGAGVIGDISTPEQRGRRVSYFQLGTLSGPALGPLIGGILGEYVQWPSIFWLLTALSGFILISVTLFLPETLRAIVGNGSIPARGLSVPLWARLRSMTSRARRQGGPVNAIRPEQQFPQAPPRNLKTVLRRILKPVTLLKEPDMAVLLFYSSLSYTLYYCVTSSSSTLFKQVYHLNYAQIGLAYLGIGCGTVMGSFVAGRLLDKDFRAFRTKVLKERARETGEPYEKLLAQLQRSKRPTDLAWFPIEAARIRNQFVYTPALVACTIAMGWTFEAKTHIAAPIIFSFFIGLLQVGVMTTTSVLMIDLFPTESATSTSTNNLVRCLLGAGGLAVIDPILNTMGPGFGFLMLSLIVLASLPLLILLKAKGPGWRQKRAARQGK